MPEVDDQLPAHVIAAAKMLFEANRTGIRLAAEKAVSICGTNDLPRLMAMTQKMAFYLGVAAAISAIAEAQAAAELVGTDTPGKHGPN
jgi:hypothetical protein